MTRYIANIAAGSFVLFYVLLNSDGEYNTAVSFVTLALNFLAVMRVRKNWYLFTIYSCILYCNYSVLITLYLTRDVMKSIFTTYAGTATGIQGLNILCAFSLLMLMAAPKIYTEGKNNIKSLIVDNRDNPFLVISLIILLILVCILGFGRPEVRGQRGSPSAFYEYSTILVIIGFYYSGSRPIFRRALVFISAMYALQNFIYGGRVTGLQLMLIIIFSLYAEKLSFLPLAFLGAIVFILMAAIGSHRANLVLSGNVISGVISSLSKGKLALDTAFSSYHCSMTFLDTLNFTGWGQRLYLFSRWLLSMLLGNSVSDSQLALYTSNFFAHYGGGILPYFGYFYLSLPGLVFMALYCAFIFSLINKSGASENGLIRCISVYVTTTVLRWWLYSPSQIIRGVMLVCLVWYVFDYADRAMKIYSHYIHKKNPPALIQTGG